MAFKGGKFTIIEEGVEGSNVHGLSALLGQLDEKRNARQREQDEVMERVQRRMAVGWVSCLAAALLLRSLATRVESKARTWRRNDVLASQAGGVELGSLGVGLKNMVRKTLAPNSQAGKALKQAAEAADFGAEREEDRKEELAAVQEEDKEPVDDVPIYTSGIFAVKPDHQVCLRWREWRSLAFGLVAAC